MDTGFLGGLFSGVGNIISTAMQNTYNQQLAEQQNQYNIDMWKMQADYNSPSAQMQRYKDAGLNENLIYGSGTSNGNMSSAPQLQAAQKVAPSFDNVGNILSDISSIFNIKKQAEEVQQEKAETQVKWNEVNNLSLTNEILHANLQSILAKSNLTNSRWWLEQQKNNAYKEWTDTHGRNYFYGIFDTQYEKLLAEYAVTNLRKDLYEQQKGLNGKKSKLFDKQINALDWALKQAERDYEWTPYMNASTIFKNTFGGLIPSFVKKFLR